MWSTLAVMWINLPAVAAVHKLLEESAFEINMTEIL